MLYNNDFQGTGSTMVRDKATQDVARDLQAEVWREVRDAFAVRQAQEGLTQAELARRMGLPRERIHYWLGRADRMTLAAAARLMAGMNARLECRARLEPVASLSEAAE